MLKNLIVAGGSAVIMKEIADWMRQGRILREKKLRRKQAGVLALGVTIAGTVGAVAGVLFAPREGKKTREDLSRRGCEVWENVKENASYTGHALASAVEGQTSRVHTAAEKCVVAAKGALKQPRGEGERTDGKKLRTTPQKGIPNGRIHHL